MPNIHFKIKYTKFKFPYNRLACLMACWPAVKLSTTMTRAPVVSHNKGNRIRFTKLVPKNVYPLRHGASFYHLLVSFLLQITYRKVRNLQISINKFVG